MRPHTFILLLLIGAALIACQNRPVSPPDTQAWSTYTGDGFSVKYPPTLARFDVLERRGEGVKTASKEVMLIHPSRASAIDPEECTVTDTGTVYVKECEKVRWESGISFLVQDGNIDTYTELIKADGADTVTINGREIVKSHQEFPRCTYPKDENGEERPQCVDEGELDTYYISLGPDRTLLVRRDMKNQEGLEGFPSEALVEGILSTLIIG